MKVVVPCATGTAWADAAPPGTGGLLTSDYRAAVPATVNGWAASTTAEAEAVWRKVEAVFVDTLPRPPRLEELPAGTIWNPKLRDDIPGSISLPNTGYGDVPPVMELHFEPNPREVTRGDHGR